MRGVEHENRFAKDAEDAKQQTMRRRRPSPKGVADFDQKNIENSSMSDNYRMQRFAVMVGNLTECVAFSLMFPLLPGIFNANDPGSAASYGYLQSVSNMFGLIGGILLGKISDHAGRKIPLLICNVCGLVGTILLGFHWVSFSCAAFGLLLRSLCSTCNKTLCKAVIVDKSDVTVRAGSLAVLNTFNGFGWTIGMSLSGLLAAQDERFPLACSILLSFVATMAFVIVLDSDEAPPPPIKGGDTAPPQPAAVAAAAVQTSHADPISTHGALYSLVTENRMVAALLFTRVCVSFAAHCFLSTFPLLLAARFGYGKAEVGYNLSFLSTAYAVSNAVVVQPITKFGLANEALFAWATCFLIASRFITAAATHISFVLIGEVCLAIGSGMFSTLTATLLSTYAKGDVGLVLAASESIKSAFGIVGPAISGILFEYCGPAAPSIVAGLVTCAGFCVYCAELGCMATAQVRESADLSRGGKSGKLQ
jgi:MFS family permease